VTKLPTAALDAAMAAPVAVLAWAAGDGSPRACAVTPYVDAGDLVITSTLAYPAKARAMRRDPRIAILVAGHHINGHAEVAVADSRWFDAHVRQQEAAKFPPSRSLFAIPGHRCLVPWYVQRIVVRVLDPMVTRVDGDDAATVTTVGVTGPTIRPVARPLDLDATTIPVAGAPDGAADLLVHEEYADLADLRQANRRGVVEDGLLSVTRSSGTLAPGPSGAVAQIGELRSLARRARDERGRISGWPRLTG